MPRRFLPRFRLHLRTRIDPCDWSASSAYMLPSKPHRRLLYLCVQSSPSANGSVGVCGMALPLSIWRGSCSPHCCSACRHSRLRGFRHGPEAPHARQPLHRDRLHPGVQHSHYHVAYLCCMLSDLLWASAPAADSTAGLSSCARMKGAVRKNAGASGGSHNEQRPGTLPLMPILCLSALGALNVCVFHDAGTRPRGPCSQDSRR